jgi:hypothetical protein
LSLVTISGSSTTTMNSAVYGQSLRTPLPRVSLALLALLGVVSLCDATGKSLGGIPSSRLPFYRSQTQNIAKFPLCESNIDDVLALIRRVRSGASDDEETDGEESEDESDVSDEEDIVSEPPKEAPVSAAKTVSESLKNEDAMNKLKKTVTAKATIPKPKPAAVKKASSASWFHVPYIIRAFLNPFTVARMTRGYWLSLFNLDFMKEVCRHGLMSVHFRLFFPHISVSCNSSPQDAVKGLRSAVEERAQPSSARPKKKQKFKPGQAKSLSDLPRLNTCSG